MRGYFILLAVFVSTLTFGQGGINLTTVGNATPWSPQGALTKTFLDVGTPAVNVTATVEGDTRRFNNSTPRNDSRGLWLSASLGTPIERVTVTFNFSSPVTNLSFRILGIDRDLSFSNYQDRVAIDGRDATDAGITPEISYNPSTSYLSNGELPHIKNIYGFTADPFDSTSAEIVFRNVGVKKLTLTFGSGLLVREGPLTTQSIFISSLSWSNVVPVQLIYFRGQAESNRVRLNWATATETNSDYFSIERSVDLKEFLPIGKITSLGESRQRHEYSFLDEAPLPGVNYYRLKQVDKDLAFEYSKIIAVSSQSQASDFVIYPNPSDGKTIKLQFDNIELDALRLVNMVGQEIPFEIQASSTNSLTIRPFQELRSGLYFITYATLGRNRITQKLWVNQ